MVIFSENAIGVTRDSLERRNEMGIPEGAAKIVVIPMQENKLE